MGEVPAETRIGWTLEDAAGRETDELPAYVQREAADSDKILKGAKNRAIFLSSSQPYSS